MSDVTDAATQVRHLRGKLQPAPPNGLADTPAGKLGKHLKTEKLGLTPAPIPEKPALRPTDPDGGIVKQPQWDHQKQPSMRI